MAMMRAILFIGVILFVYFIYVFCKVFCSCCESTRWIKLSINCAEICWLSFLCVAHFSPKVSGERLQLTHNANKRYRRLDRMCRSFECCGWLGSGYCECLSCSCILSIGFKSCPFFFLETENSCDYHSRAGCWSSTWKTKTWQLGGGNSKRTHWHSTLIWEGYGLFFIFYIMDKN